MKRLVRTYVFEGSDERIAKVLERSLEDGTHLFGGLSITVATVAAQAFGPGAPAETHDCCVHHGECKRSEGCCKHG